MKKDIHPAYNQKAKITCSCGNVLEVGSTLPEIHVEICSNCHPFFTGKQKYIDTAGRIDRFKAKLEAREKFAAKPVVKKDAEAAPVKEEVETSKEDAAPEVTEEKTAEEAPVETDNNK